MAKVEIYYHSDLIKRYEIDKVDEKILDGIIEFVIEARETLSGTTGIVMIDNMIVESSENLEKIIIDKLEKGKNVKIEIKSIMLLDENTRSLENQVATMIPELMGIRRI
ncbi:MAG: hypothetical protein ACP6IP_06820 [Candidatus Njordarchaeia archaeon]